MVINLAPADLPKEAASFDLPMALGILLGSGQMQSELLEHYAVVGELALDGTTRPTKGPCRWPWLSPNSRPAGILVPSDSAAEAAVVEKIDVIPIASLAQAVAFLAEEIEIEPVPSRLINCFASCRSMRRILPTSVDRKWPNGR